ncbi:MAG: GNAT family N-acetyltransferase [Eubacterium sp.]|nr:GNAT family N-acetyltransferase [Eubacterium sp.]
MKNKCPCCGCYTLEEDYGSYEICPVCFWEEDPAAEKNPNIVFGGNSVSLHQAQENYRKIGACDADQLQHVRKPLPEEVDPKVAFQFIRVKTLPQLAGMYYMRIAGMQQHHDIPLEDEFDEHDNMDTLYMIVLDGIDPIATARMFFISDTEMMIGRVIVMPRYRRMGVARKILMEMEDWARELGIKTMVGESRTGLEHYYESLGFTIFPDWLIQGPTFLCVHMEKKI